MVRPITIDDATGVTKARQVGAFTSADISVGQRIHVFGDLDLAIEIKASAGAGDGQAQGLRALGDDQKVRRSLIVSLDERPRTLSGGIEVWPWHLFCEGLWAGEWV